jgi:hypothetical protein
VTDLDLGITARRSRRGTLSLKRIRFRTLWQPLTIAGVPEAPRSPRPGDVRSPSADRRLMHVVTDGLKESSVGRTSASTSDAAMAALRQPDEGNLCTSTVGIT